MSAAHLDTAASAPAATPSGLAGESQVARGRSRLRRWLGEMADIGANLMENIGRIAAFRRTNPAIPPGVDLGVVGALVARAMRWSRALQARFAAEKKARAAQEPATRDRLQPATRDSRQAGPLDGALAGIEGMLRGIRRELEPAAAPVEKPEPDDCIDGKATAEVVGQICADLGIAATLMRGARAARQIEAIAAKARALLGGPEEPWTAPPIPPPRDSASDEHMASLQDVARQMLAPVATPVPVPDTG